MSEVVPEGWSLKTLGDLAKVKRGASPRPIQDPKWWGGTVGWTRISDVTSSSKYLTETSDYLSDEGVEKSVQIPVGEVILSICATIGRPIIIKTDVCIHDGFVWFDGLSNDIDREFYYYFLKSKEEILSSSRQTGTQGNLNTDIVSRLPIHLPPLPEQKKIASILTSVDEVIEKTQSQIDKLQDLKKGTMNELLTKGIGHTEFKDSELGRIPKSWEVKRLGEVGRFSKGKGISKKDIVTRGVPCIRYAEIYTEYDFVIKKFKSFIHPNERSNSKKIQKNDIIFAGSGETVEDIGKSVAFVSDIEAFVGGDAILLSPSNEIDSVFLSYQLNDGIRRMQLRKLGQGSSVIHIYSSGLEEIVVSLPPIFEQTKIASIISSVEEKIEQL